MEISTMPPTAFGESFVIESSAHHSQTIISLHGRGSTGEEFADEFFDTGNGDHAAIAVAANALLPSCRWVFPSSRSLWSETFQEYMPAWFNALSLTDPSVGRDLQAPGIRDAVDFTHSILENEITRLNGDSSKVFLGGISQGGAIAMWTLFTLGTSAPKLGGFIMVNTWLPFAEDAQHVLCGTEDATSTQERHQHAGIDTFASDMLAATRILDAQSRDVLLSTPVFSGHGTDDAYVDFELGRQARDVFRKIRFNVECYDYSGAEQEGHWLKEPEEVDDMIAFVQRHM
ncbi:Alpha/Beta hydrolase protein [Microdochium bolleyi]|uniref:Alpha/Beta hydrolase protein n=1 Tax=Microdochium bolleyi TaxID=196109 RepID=A0A136J3P4_9PEZI|nr:Alpha/Beta hydrolase protein [Microdochium bolleyi]